jgi:glutamyl-tRNA reductase
VGAGKMAESAARHLRRAGVSEIAVTNRTRSRADAIAEEFQGRTIDYDKFSDALPDVDILLASSGAPHYIVTREQMRAVLGRRKNRPMFLIDIAVPRNIEPSINDLDNVFLYDIDDLQEVVNANLRERMKEAGHAEQMVTDEVERMMARLKVAEVTPTIVGFQEQLEQIRLGELEKVRRRLGALTPEQEEALEALTRGIINKVAHGPISQLRLHAGKPEGAHVVAAIRKAFHLQD